MANKSMQSLSLSLCPQTSIGEGWDAVIYFTRRGEVVGVVILWDLWNNESKTYLDIILKNVWICSINLVSALCSTRNIWDFALCLDKHRPGPEEFPVQLWFNFCVLHWAAGLAAVFLWAVPVWQSPPAMVWVWGCQWTAGYFFFNILGVVLCALW